MNRTFVSIGAWLGFLAVGFGAFMAHVFKQHHTADEYDIWRTAAQYQAIHSLALILVGIMCGQVNSRLFRAAGWLFLAGVVLFSGSLYLLALTEVRLLGLLTPFGGLCFLMGWVAMAVGTSLTDRSGTREA